MRKIVFARGNQKPITVLRKLMYMAHIERGKVVLSPAEQAILKEVLRNPPRNIDRELFMRKIESISIEETDFGICIHVPDLDIRTGEEVCEEDTNAEDKGRI